MNFCSGTEPQGTRVSVYAIAFWSTHLVGVFFRFSRLLPFLWRWGAK